MNTKPSFESGYQGESTYTYRGGRYGVRSSATDWRPNYWNYTPEEYQAQRVALVGTITGPSVTEFPPEELEQFFPGYVRAKFDPTTWTVVYATRPPEIVHSPIYGTLSKVWAEELERNNVPLRKVEV